MQDNAPAHTSAYTRTKLVQWGIQTVEWPAESPDLNPIELVWGSMKAYIRFAFNSLCKQLRRNKSSSQLSTPYRRHECKTQEDLCRLIKHYWNSLTPQACTKYIGGIPWRMVQVAAAQGGNILERKEKK